MIAVGKGFYDKVKLLLVHGANPNRQCATGFERKFSEKKEANFTARKNRFCLSATRPWTSLHIVNTRRLFISYWVIVLIRICRTKLEKRLYIELWSVIKMKMFKAWKICSKFVGKEKFDSTNDFPFVEFVFWRPKLKLWFPIETDELRWTTPFFTIESVFLTEEKAKRRTICFSLFD